MELWPTDAEEIVLLRERVDEASRVATNELKDLAKSGHMKKRRRDEGEGGKDDMDRDDDVVEAGLPGKKRSKGRR